MLQLWVSGNEYLYYSGGTAALNRVLKRFAEAEAAELYVVLRPGPGRTVAVDGRPRQVDWQIQAVVHGQSAVVGVAHRLATVATFLGIIRRLATALPRIRLAHRG